MLKALGVLSPDFRRMADANLAQKQYDKVQRHGSMAPITSPVSADLFVKRSARVTFGTSAVHSVSPQEKLSRMAAQLNQHGLDAYYIPPEDEHLNEYLPDTKKRIEWLTGFTGESAPLLVTPKKMYLYPDGRFHLQVDAEVDAHVVEAHKLGVEGVDTLEETLQKLAKSHSADHPLTVGYDPFLVSPNRLKALQEKLGTKTPIKWVPVSGNLVDPTWTGRPTLPQTPAFLLDKALTGRSIEEKLQSIRGEMSKAQADILPITKLDDVAWLFNLRGNDIPYNPVLEAYGILTQDKAHLFADLSKIPSDAQQALGRAGVQIEPYGSYETALNQLLQSHPSSVMVDRDSLTLGTLNLVEGKAQLVEKPNPITLQKAIKNQTEIEKMLQANFRASRAIIRHLAYVDDAFSKGKRFSEAEVRSDLESKYQAEPEFHDLSFPTIPGIGSNSAIIHYSKADPHNIGQAGDFYLLDSGCQYLGGTTDTTRTTIFGQATPDQIEKYTAVLKAHIDCANYRFLDGTNGMQIDAVCRHPMGQMGLDFAHGTGHGVGAFLNVHEGPNRISRAGTVVFKPGMVTSIEPGYYQKDWGGIRLENLYYVTEDKSKPPFQGKPWYQFTSLTFVPFEKKLIDFSKLTDDELAWLQDYYHQIWQKLSPTLSPEEKAWLKDQISIP